MGNVTFSPVDFPPYHSFTTKDLLPVIEKPEGNEQIVAVARLLRSTLNRRDRQAFDKEPIGKTVDLVIEYLRLSVDYEEMLIEREMEDELASRGTAG
jgi:hypothetical protein